MNNQNQKQNQYPIVPLFVNDEGRMPFLSWVSLREFSDIEVKKIFQGDLEMTPLITEKVAGYWERDDFKLSRWWPDLHTHTVVAQISVMKEVGGTYMGKVLSWVN